MTFNLLVDPLLGVGGSFNDRCARNRGLRWSTSQKSFLWHGRLEEAWTCQLALSLRFHLSLHEVGYRETKAM